ncbi:hypothetical protein D3C79_924470 [compost metagenome]
MRLITQAFKTNNGELSADAHHHVGVIDRLVITIHRVKPDNLIAGVTFKFVAYLRRTAGRQAAVSQLVLVIQDQ